LLKRFSWILGVKCVPLLQILGRWEDGKMERWEDGKMERWEDGKMEIWEDGKMG
jgi:hypothetical protein